MAGSGFSYALIGAALLAVVASRVDRPNPPQTVAVAKAAPVAAAPPISSGIGSVVIERAADGHFYADAKVNGIDTRFLVDTGATSVVLTRADARRAGIGAGDFTARAMGAGGEVRLQPVTLARLAIGPMAADNVPAMVAEQGLPVSLMGQSMLRRWGEVTIAGDRMVLR